MSGDTLCPYCQTRPLLPYRGAGKHPVHCGERQCRLVRRRETNWPAHDLQARRRKAARAGLSFTRKTRHRLQCAYCSDAFWTDDAGQVCCSRSCAARLQFQARVQPKPVRPSPTPSRGPRHESAATVDELLAAAKAARLAEERATGQRRYTITDGWAQRPGRSTLDGEMRVLEVGGD
jgi:hypothetical protein